MDLDNLKYSELQKLAKSAGIRANMKVEKLVKALKEHYNKQGHRDSQSNMSDVDSNTQTGSSASSAEEDHNPAADDDEVKDDRTKKKAPDRGRKKGQKKGTRGKTKKTSSSEESQEEEVQLRKTGTPKTTSTSSKQPTPRGQQKGTPVARQTPSTKTTPLGATPNISKTPKIVKPVLAKSVQNRTPGVKKTPAIVKPVLAKTPLTNPENTPASKTISGKNTPGLFSPRGLKPTNTAEFTPKKLAGSGNESTSSVTYGNNKTPTSGSTKRRSPRNQEGTKDKQLAKAKANASPALTESGNKRKRRDTFELDGPSLDSADTPEAEKTAKRVRLSSGAHQEAKRTQSSPGIQDMLDSMSGEISSAERRNRLISAINKKVEGKVKNSPHAASATQIPRFAAFLAKRKQEQKKPITPGNKDWEKVHKKAFAKFDSIDVYLDKKRKRAEEMTASVKKARTVLHEVQEAVTKLKSKRTPSLGRKAVNEPFKPSVISTKDMNLNFGAAASSKKTSNNRKSTTASKPFKPAVTSTKDMNLNFSSLKTPVNEKTGTKQATPASSMMKSAYSARKSVGASQMSARKSLGASAARKSLSHTPFQFTGNLNTSEVKSTTKPVFDLKASLARPITWKPHTGRLKPMGTTYVVKGKEMENSASKPSASHMDIFKSRTIKTYSRRDRRIAEAARRAQEKGNLQMKRRGITESP